MQFWYQINCFHTSCWIIPPRQPNQDEKRIRPHEIWSIWFSHWMDPKTVLLYQIIIFIDPRWPHVIRLLSYNFSSKSPSYNYLNEISAIWSFRKSEIRFSYLSKLNFASAKSLYKMVNQKTISPSRKLIPRSSRHGWTICWFWYRKPTFLHGEIQGNNA